MTHLSVRHHTRVIQQTCWMNSLATRLRTVREEKNLSQGDLARKAGVSKSTVSSIEQGRSKGTTLIVPIAKALGVREEWLVSGKGRREAPMSDRLTPDQEYYVVAKSPEELAEQLLAKGDEHVLQLLSLVMRMKNGSARK